MSRNDAQRSDCDARRTGPEGPAEAAAAVRRAHASRPEADPAGCSAGARQAENAERQPKVRYPVETLTREEVQRLIAACSLRSFSGSRNRALVVLLYRSGLRLSEALDLFPKDLNVSSGEIRVLHGKGDKTRSGAIDPEAIEVLARWLDRRDAAGISRRCHLICSRHGTRLCSSYVRALFKRLAARAGIEKRVHPHALRHTYAAQLAAEGKPINLIQAALGHSNAATTSRYLAHIAPQALIDMAKGRTWNE